MGTDKLCVSKTGETKLDQTYCKAVKDDSKNKYIKDGLVVDCKAQTGCKTYGDVTKCLGTDKDTKKCTHVLAGYKVDSAGFVARCAANKKSNDNDQGATCSGTCSAQSDCKTASTDKLCVSKTGETKLDQTYCKAVKDDSKNKYIKDGLVVDCKAQTGCKTYGDVTKCLGTDKDLKKCTHALAGYKVDSAGFVAR